MNVGWRNSRSAKSALALACLVLTVTCLADGMVVPQEFFPKVQIPNQQAFIQFSNGMERLVIETAFLGEGTNFAWVVPLPSEPEVKAVSEHFFEGLQRMFAPRLVHEVMPYYATVIFFCGLLFLGARAMKDEVSWVYDLPLCLALAAAEGILGRHFVFGALAAALALYLRIFARTPASLAAGLVVGLVFSLGLTVLPRTHGFGLIQTLGSGSGEEKTVAGVKILSVQRAGVFESTVIRGDSPNAVSGWLKQNGFVLSQSAEEAIRYYQGHGWVFVASHVRRAEAQSSAAVLHPLLFTFAAPAPLYPTRLTAVDNGDCAIDLYVFGERRAKARCFEAVRCDRVGSGSKSVLQAGDPELASLVGNSTVGTKLSGRLSPKQMAATDVKITSTMLWRTGGTVFSYIGAMNIALNVALPLGLLGWFLLGASRGGWEVDERWVRRWRFRFLALVAALGLVLFMWMPKVEVQSRFVAPAREWVGE